MFNSCFKEITFDKSSKLIILVFSVLQLTRCVILPQSMDIHYHFLTSWGFIRAGGYSNWDFWQYAPVGRVHFYPPVFHFIIAVLIKIGLDKIFLMKVFEYIIPIIFLTTIWDFIRKNYEPRLAFFVVILSASSFLFYMNLINHIPSTLGIIFGILALGQILKNRIFYSTLLLCLCFYTHIGVGWFFYLSVIFWAVLNRDIRGLLLKISFFTLVLSLPIIFSQLLSLKYISRIGIYLNDRNYIQLKPIETILAVSGIFLALKLPKKYSLFLGVFLASFIFLDYPYRFFCCEGYLAVILLSALTLDALYKKLKKNVIVLLMLVIFLVAPSIIVDKAEGGVESYKLLLNRSAFLGMVFPAEGKFGLSNSMWFDGNEYKYASRIISSNSEKDDIIYCTENCIGICLANISGRATANGLLIEVDPSERFDPFLVSKIIIFIRDDDFKKYAVAIDYYKLIKIDESKLFVFYKNPVYTAKIKVKKAVLPFGAVISAGGLLLLCVFVYKQKGGWGVKNL